MDTHVKATDSSETMGRLPRNTKLALLSAVAIGAFFVLREHWEHALGLLPYLLLISCPLLHLFGHSHHRHRDHEEGHNHTRFAE